MGGKESKICQENLRLPSMEEMKKVGNVSKILGQMMLRLAEHPELQMSLLGKIQSADIISSSDVEGLKSKNPMVMASVAGKMMSGENIIKVSKILGESKAELERVGLGELLSELMSELGKSSPVNMTGAYQMVMNSCAVSGGGEGEGEGCGCMGGSGSSMLDVQKYDKTLNAEAKEKIISGVIDIMKSMGFKDIKSSGSRAEILSSIIKAIPNREKNKKSFTNDVVKQEHLCKNLAKYINKHFDNVIDMNASVELICHQVSELLYSLFMGMHVEFMAVAADVGKVLMNMRYVKDLLKEQMDSLLVASQKSNDAELQSKTAKMRGAYEILLKELERQMVMLQGLLNVNLSSEDVSITELLKEQSNIFGLLEKFDKPAGSALFSDYLSNIMTGVGITAQFARVVDDALKVVGMTLSQYVKDENPSRLFDDLAKLILESSGDDVKKEKMILAAEFLRKNFYQSKDIEKKLKEVKTGSSDNFSSEDLQQMTNYESYNHDSDDSSSSDDEKSGGDIRELWESSQGLTMDRRVKTKQAMKNLMFRTFNRQLTSLLDSFVKAVCSLVRKVGTEVPVTEQLDGLRQALSNIDNSVFEKQNLYLSLVGYFNDASSMQSRQTFLAQMDVVKSYVDTMLQMSAYRGTKELVDMSSLIGSMKQLLDEYADKLKEKYGAEERVGGLESGLSGLGDLLSGGDMSRNLKSASKLKDAIGTFGYYFKAADIRFNLARSGKEIENYAENYDDILGSAIAREIDAVRRSYYSDDASKRNQSTGGIIDILKSKLVNANDTDKKLLNGAIKLHEEQMESRVTLWRTIEAIDQYLKYFTKGLVENPDDVKDIVSMIEDVSVINKWYDSESGESLCRMFDSFGVADDGKLDQAESALRGPTDEHYYKRLSTVLASGKLPGNPFYAVSVETFMAENSGQSNLRKALSNMKALKNLTSVFAYIGEKFGSSVVHKQTFMTPTQIYKSLLQYLEYSSYEVGTGDLSSVDVGKLTSVKMRSIGVGSNLLGGVKTWTKEDDYFAMVVKCMCAKVLTVVGMYDLFKRPSNVSYMNPVRMILGAAEDVKVETKAVELYVRLPLLVEFYRQLFGFDENTSYDHSADGVINYKAQDDDVKFAMLPEMEGLFGGLINLIFMKRRGLDLKAYSDDDIREVIREVNIIYAKMSARHPAHYVKETINELVQEVNRRYGLLKLKTRDQYMNENNDLYAYSNAENQKLKLAERSLDLDILPDESEFDVNKPAPSRKYERVSDPSDPTSGKAEDYRFEIKKEQQQLFYKFRCMLDNALVGTRVNENKLVAGPELSFKPAIKSAMSQLSLIDRSEERFKIVANLMRGENMLVGADRAKYLLFHETVVSGLNVLSAIHTFLARARMNVLALSALVNESAEKSIEKYFGSKFVVSRILNSDYWPSIPKQLVDAVNAKDYSKMLDGLLSTVFGVSKDLQGLVDVKVDDRIYINWGGLKKTIDELFGGVKYFMDLLRPNLESNEVGKDLIKYYSDKETPGSYYYLQERLMEQLLIGRRSSVSSYMSLDDMSKAMNEVYAAIRSASTGSLLGDLVSAKVFYSASIPLTSFKYGEESYSAYAAASAVNWLNPSSLERLLVNVQGSVKTSFPGVAFRYKHLYDSESPQQLTDNRSLMFMMNQLIARFLYTFMDQNTNKIYLGCVDGLINGVFNSVITNVGQSFPDCNTSLDAVKLENSSGDKNKFDSKDIWTLMAVELGRATTRLVQVQQNAGAGINNPVVPGVPNSTVNAVGALTNMADPKNGQILFTSLAVMLYNILSSKDSAGNPYYIERDLTAVPAYMKEKFRANMPGFANLFKELLDMTELYKSVVNNKDLILNRNPNAGINKVIDGITLQDYDASSESTKKVLVYILNDISRVSAAMFKSCSQIVREVSDEPKHFETSKGSIEDFKMLNHKLPFMPVSNLLYVLHNTDTHVESLYDASGRDILSEHDFLPFNAPGEDAFKMMYGTRVVFAKMDSSVSMKSLLGLESLIAEYNSASDSKFSVNAGKADQFFQYLIKGVRYCHDVKNLKGAFVSNKEGKSFNFNKFNLHSENVVNNVNLNTVSMATGPLTMSENGKLPKNLRISYAIAKTLSEVLALSESSQVSERQSDVVNHIALSKVTDSSSTLRIQNILDMNIVPINVNAMMRELPLVNLYNYSYTFDRMIVELFYGVGGELGMDLIRNLCQINARNQVSENYNSDQYAGNQNLDQKYNKVGPGTDAEKSSTSMFLSLLVNPYKPITTNESFVYLTGLFVGNQDSSLSRPKYLSDQIYGKVLFGSLYEGYDATAPHSILRGPQFNNTYPQVSDVTNIPSLMDRALNTSWLHNATDKLVYLKNKGVEIETRSDKNPPENKYGWANIVAVDTNGKISDLRKNSKERLNTVLIRNLMMIVNSYRALRLKIANDYNYSPGSISKSRFMTRDTLTEFSGNQVE